MAAPTIPTATVDAIRATLIEEAEEAHAEFPQYRGYWNGWKVGRIVRDLQWRNYAGPEHRMAAAGEYVLVDDRRDMWSSSCTVTAFLRNTPIARGHGCNTAIYPSEVEILG